MSSVHAGQNPREVQRVNSEHPVTEARTVLRNQRLLGKLLLNIFFIKIINKQRMPFSTTSIWRRTIQTFFV